jgi:quercetin dioxygenase-like cupin family protein
MAANVQQSTDNYFTVKSIETVLEAADVKARIFTLAPSDVIPWHYHCDITDHFLR